MRPCPCCGRSRACIGEQTAEQLDLEPVKFFVLRTVKKSYACRHCDPVTVPSEQRIRTAGPAQVGPIAKGLCGPGLLAHVVSDAGDERAAKALELFGRLYAIERALPALLPPSDDPAQREQRRQREEQRRTLRQRDAEPVWVELSKWLAEQKPGALPKSPLGGAIGYPRRAEPRAVDDLPDARLLPLDAGEDDGSERKPHPVFRCDSLVPTEQDRSVSLVGVLLQGVESAREVGVSGQGIKYERGTTLDGLRK